jgi:hypothetical protein
MNKALLAFSFSVEMNKIGSNILYLLFGLFFNLFQTSLPSFVHLRNRSFLTAILADLMERRDVYI